MKRFLMLFLLSFLLGIQCKNATKPVENTRPVMEKVEESGPEFSSKYVCPMHCKGSGSDHAGKCPVCEMDYELNESIQQDSIQ